MPPGDEIVNPNEHLKIPEWINADYFKGILAEDEPNHVRVSKFTPIAAIPPGENFTSVMLRIHMDLEMKDGSSKHKTYVLKTMLDDDKGGTIVKQLSFFPKEMEMYRRYIHAFEALYKDAGRDVQLAPKCLLSEVCNGRINIVFEDLKIRHFQIKDRLEGLDMPHMRRVLQKLAEFHAASAVYAEQNGAYPEEFNHGFVRTGDCREFFKTSYYTKLKAYKEAMSLWGLEDADKYIRKFPTFEQFWNCGLRTIDHDPSAFNVLAHGDFWSSNFMFNYLPDGAVDELVFLDFQICKWGSPAADLLFVIIISASKDIRIAKFDYFVEIYHEHLIQCLKLLKYKKPLPKLRELQISMYQENVTFYAFFAVYNHLVVLLLPTDKDSSIHSTMREDEFGEQFRLRAFSNPLYAEAMRDLFPFFHHRGLFNFEDFDD